MRLALVISGLVLVILIVLISVVLKKVFDNQKEEIWVCTEKIENTQTENSREYAEYDKQGNLTYFEIVETDTGDNTKSTSWVEYEYDTEGYLSGWIKNDGEMLVERDGLRFTIYYPEIDREYVREFNENGRLIFRQTDGSDGLNYDYYFRDNVDTVSIYSQDRNGELVEEIKFKYKGELLEEIEVDELGNNHSVASYKYDQENRVSEIKHVVEYESGISAQNIWKNTYYEDSIVEELTDESGHVNKCKYKLDENGNPEAVQWKYGELPWSEKDGCTYKYEKRSITKQENIINTINTALINEFCDDSLMNFAMTIASKIIGSFRRKISYIAFGQIIMKYFNDDGGL